MRSHDAKYVADALSRGNADARFACLVLLMEEGWQDDAFIEPIEALRKDYSPVMFGEPLLVYANAYLQKFGIREYQGRYKFEVDKAAA